MGVTLDQVYTFLKTILESSSEARLRISANDVTKRIEFQPASTTGLNETEVDTRVAAGVEDWAETNNADTIPVDKIPADIARDAEVDKSIVDGVADWARLPDESIRIPTDKLLPVYSSGMIWGIWNAAITPGFQSFANTYEFGSSNFGTYQSSARPSVSAATRYLYIHVPIIEPDIEQWTTEGGSDQFAELVKQGSTHVYNGTTYKWWRSRNKIALSTILNGKRWRFYNQKAELTEKEVSEVDARVLAKVEDWAEDGNADLIPSTKLPASVGIDQSAVDARVKAGVQDWAETSDTTVIPKAKLPTPVVPGLDQSAVDARVVAGVESWAAEGDVTVIPTTKLPAPVVPGLDQAAVDARVAAKVEDWAEDGDVTVIPTTKLPAPVVPGLDQAAVDARVAAKVEDWAEDGNTDAIPVDKLANAPSGSGGGLNRAAVDARVVAGVESWAAEGDVEVIPTDKLPAPVVPGLDQAAVDARVAAKVEDWAEEGDQSAIPAAKLTNAPSGGSATAASSYTDVLTWTRNSDFVNGIVYQTAIEVDVAKDFMHIALNQSSSANAPAELAFMRIRTAEWLALPVDTEPSGGRFRENDDNSGILVYATDDVFQVITLHLRRYVSSSKNLLSVGAKINTSDPPSGRINGIRYFYEHSGAVGSSGLDQAAVDARVAAKVEDWAEDGNADAIPAKKLTNAPAGGGGGLDRAAVDARVAAKVEDWAEEGDTTIIPFAKLPTLASTYTDVETLTYTGDLTAGLLYQTAIEVDVTKDFMHIALSVSGTSTPRELEYARIRTDEWLALAVDTTTNASAFAESDGKSGILAYATDDRFNVISLHLRRYVNAGKSLLSIGIKALPGDTPAADINGIRYFYESAGTAGGINRADVNALVKSGVQDWAETSNLDTIPTAKLPPAVGNSDITILGPRHTLVKADYLANKTFWNGQQLVPITREVTDAHNAIYRFATIDSTPGSSSLGKEIISLTFNYASMHGSFDQNSTRAWIWAQSVAVKVGDICYTTPGGVGAYHRCIRLHTTSASGADGPPDSADQTGWQPYSLRSIANRANYLGVYNTSGEVASTDLADGKWIITTAGQFVIAQIYNGGGWSSYVIPLIGSFNGTNFADHDAAGNAVQDYNSSLPDYFMVNDSVNILTFLIPADAGVEGFHGTAPERRDPVIVLWGRGQTHRIGSDDNNGPASNVYAQSIPGTEVSRYFLRLLWKDSPSESYFGANRGMFSPVGITDSGFTGIDYVVDPLPAGHGFRLAPGLWSLRCWINIPWASDSFPSVRILKVVRGSVDPVLGLSQVAPAETLTANQIGTPDQNSTSFTEALYINVEQGDVLYAIVVGVSSVKNPNLWPWHHMFCWYHG